MIGYIKGNIKYKGMGYVVIEVNNIGYKVETIKSILLKGENEEVEVFIYPDLTERGTRLFGFNNPDEIFLFEKLKSINGVGSKSALNIISSSDFKSIIDIIDTGNTSFLSSIHGVGKKTAERIILDLKGKIEQNDTNDDIYKALMKLGYSQKEISSIYGNIKEIESLEDAIKEALKLLSKG